MSVIVLDENDHAPEFTSPLYEGRITENSPPGTKVNLSIPITATDKDEGINQNFVFTLHGEGSELFRIHPTTGLVYFEGIDDRTLDREARANYSFTIVAKDNGKISFPFVPNARLLFSRNLSLSKQQEYVSNSKEELNFDACWK